MPWKNAISTISSPTFTTKKSNGTQAGKLKSAEVEGHTSAGNYKEPNLLHQEKSTPIFTVHVNQIQGKALLDTGASASTISTNFFARIICKNDSWERIDTTVVLANGDTMRAEKSIVIPLVIEFEE